MIYVCDPRLGCICLARCVLCVIEGLFEFQSLGWIFVGQGGVFAKVVSCFDFS